MLRSACPKILFVATILCLGFPPGPSGADRSGEESQTQLHTAYNIWWEHVTKVWSTNYKKGRILPAGTPVKLVRRSNKTIKFTDLNTDLTYTIVFVRNHHPGKSAGDIYDRMMTDKTFEELTAGFSELEIAAIKSGEVRQGMSKEAVLVSLGYPPESGTPSTKLDSWRYWWHRFDTFIVHFDDEDRVEDIQE